jgi:class 3 adenylate cyclase/tetratricopeptide (TPR) repeat protein
MGVTDHEAGEARCLTCGAENPAAARYCVACGTRMTFGGCASCGEPLVPGARFCAACGHAVAADTPSLRPGVPASSSETEPIGLAERRRVSVLFVDLVDFTSLAESMDPEEVRAVQSRYFEVARSIVATYGGTIEKFIGDAVMAVWGAPAAHEDDAERAVRAGMAIVYAVERIGGAATGRALRGRGAVATGEVAVTVGAVDQGLVAGDLVNVAARLQGRAPSSGVVVDRATREAATGVAFARVGSLVLKGRGQRLETFRATGLRDGGAARGVSHAGSLIGRERVLREVTDLLQGVIDDGRGRLVSVTGIAGIGKSRLAWELDRWVDAHPDDIAWHDGRALAYGEGVAFAAVAQMVRRRTRIDEAAPPELARRQLGSALAELIRDDAERRWIEPRLAALLSQETTDAYDRDELFAAWRRFFERVSELAPVVMIFEDLHWADPSLLDFVEHLAVWSRARPIFILTLARPELVDARPGWGSGVGSFTAITLERLPDDAMRELLADRAPDLEPRLVEPILRSAGGVPLYAVEVARMLIDRTDGPVAARATRLPAPSENEVPDSLHGVIAARLDALPPTERRLLMAASVLGNRFRPEVLQDVVGADPSTMRDRIDGLVRREMLSVDDEIGSPGRGQLAFVQDLVREVAYQTLAKSERRALHLAAARHFESAETDAPEPLARHLAAAHRLTAQPRDAARVAHRAVAALRRAGRAAMAIHVPSRALDLLENALALADEGTHPAVLAETADAARAAGHLERAAALLRQRIDLEERAGSSSEAARTRARLASVLLTAQANEPALQELEAALAGMRRWQQDPAGIELAAQLARARSVLGDDRAALRWARRALPAAQRLELTAAATELRITSATAQLALGEPESGLEDLRAAIAEAQEGEMLRTELRARNNLAWGLLGDDPIAAGETARLGLGLATEMGIGDFVVPLADLACTAALEAGDWDWALTTVASLTDEGTSGSYRAVLAAVAAVIEALRGNSDAGARLDRLEPLPPETDAQLLSVVRLARAWIAFLAGDLGAARELAERAIVDAPNIPLHELALAARICLWQGDRIGAEANLRVLGDPVRWGRAADAARMTMAAGLGALAGNPTAHRAYRAAHEAWDQLGLPLQRALCLLDEHRLVPGAGEPTELREVIESLGAGGLLALIDVREVRPRGEPARPARRRPSSAGTARRSDAARRSPPATGRRTPGN